MRNDQQTKYQARKSLNYEIEANANKNTESDQSNTENSHRWSSGTYVIVENSIGFDIDERHLSKKA